MFIFQFIFQKFSPDQTQGEYDYAFLEDMLKLRIEGILRSVHCDPSEFLSLDPTVLNPTLQKIVEKEQNPERKFLLLLTLAVQCAKAGEYVKVIEYLREAIKLKPDDLIANFIMAEAQEKIGTGGEAVKSYEAALRDPISQSKASLKEFISKQIERVKTEGPRKGSKHQGLRFMTW